jgi:hypothetical protein
MSEFRIQDWIDPALRRSVTIKGMLLRRYEDPEDLSLLDQDVLEVELANGIFIDVGWFPEGDPDGKFVVRVYKSGRREALREPIETKDTFEVAQLVADLIKDYAGDRPRPVAVSRSMSISVNYAPRPIPC